MISLRISGNVSIFNFHPVIYYKTNEAINRMVDVNNTGNISK